MTGLPSRSALTALVAVVLAAGTSTYAQKPRPFLFSMGRYTAAWAGRPLSYDQQLWDHMVYIGATLNGTGLAWCDVETSPGVYNWDQINYTDFNVNEMLARGIEPTMFVGLPPAWAALRPDLPPHRTPPAEEYVEEFMDFHRFVADRYKGKVKYYFFWNEPNGCSWINENCSNSNSYPLYTRWLIRCSQAIKEMDPDAKIVAANLDYHSGVTHGYQYIQGMYSEGAKPHFDIISIHPYDWAGTIHWRALTDTRNVMVANGDAHKPLWVSEYGWNSTDYQLTASKLVEVLTELKKPEWSFVEMASYLVLNDGGGVENYGLMSSKLVPRSGYWAFRNFDKTWQVVDVSASPALGSAPLNVQFTGQSTLPGISDWLWEFGDGATSTEQNPQHTYVGEGTYHVKLTVIAEGEPYVWEQPALIRVGPFPKVAFLAGQIPLAAADAGIIQRLRDKGLEVLAYDDEPASRPDAAQIAAEHDLVIASSTVLSANVAGQFRHESTPMIYWESSLGTRDREALADGPGTVAGSNQISVIDNQHPIMAGIGLGPLTVTTAGAEFSGSTGPIAPGVRVLATQVDDPNRRMVMVAEPGSVLLDGGTAAGKRVALFLYDETWLSTSTAGKTIFDNAVAYALGETTADFTADRTLGLAPLTVQFTDASTGPVTSWQWDFGDDQTSSLRHPVHTFEQPGTYDVTLTVGSPGGPETHVRTAYIVVAEGFRGDFDQDRDVDQEDFGRMQTCLSGAGIAQDDPACAAARLDGDPDVDGDDLALFLTCISGANQTPPDACAQ